MINFPEEYLQYHKRQRPLEGELNIEPGWFSLWPLDQVEKLNRQYEVTQSLPTYIGFGSNGGGELFAFEEKHQVVMVPFVGNEVDRVESSRDELD